MSYISEINSTTVWSPALLVGKLYMQSIAVLGESLGVTAGCNPLASDFIIIDPDQHRRFVAVLLDQSLGCPEGFGIAATEESLHT